MIIAVGVRKKVPFIVAAKPNGTYQLHKKAAIAVIKLRNTRCIQFLIVRCWKHESDCSSTIKASRRELNNNGVLSTTIMDITHRPITIDQSDVVVSLPAALRQS